MNKCTSRVKIHTRPSAGSTGSLSLSLWLSDPIPVTSGLLSKNTINQKHMCFCLRFTNWLVWLLHCMALAVQADIPGYYPPLFRQPMHHHHHRRPRLTTSSLIFLLPFLHCRPFSPTFHEPSTQANGRENCRSSNRSERWPSPS